MTESKFDRNKIYMTPKCRLMWCHFDVPHTFKEGPDAKYYYEAKAIPLEEAGAQKMKNIIEVASQDTHGKTHEQLPYPLWQEKEEEGEKVTEFKFKIKPEGHNPKNGNTWSNQPKYLGPDGMPFEKGVIPIGNGTIAQIGFKFDAYPGMGGGLAMRPKSIVIHELVEYTPQERKSSEDYWKEQIEQGLDEELPF